MTDGQSKILVAIPTYNEEGNVAPLVAGIHAEAPGVDVLFVDDNSQDGTARQIATLIASFPGRIHLLSRSGKLGLGTAYVAAFDWALARGYDAVIEMDADHSHRPQDLRLIVAALGKHPVVVGSRYVSGGGTENWSWWRRLISQAGSFYARLILGLGIRDLTGGFNGWRADVLRAIDLKAIKSEGYSFQIELKYRAHLAGFPIHELPILFVERRAGQSKMSGGIVLEAIHRVWALRALR
jgi:dolichol-phosphate mannosyltransferase